MALRAAAGEDPIFFISILSETVIDENGVFRTHEENKD